MEGLLIATAIRLVGTLLVSLLSWRLWRFTIRPNFHPNEPKELPYWIPFIGHAMSFLQNFSEATAKGRKHFEPLREPFAMKVAGQTIYIATSPEDVNAVWNSPKTISMDPITEEMYTGFNGGVNGLKALFTAHANAKYNEGNRKLLTPVQMVTEFHHRQLHSGPRLEELMSLRIIPPMSKKLDFSTSTTPAIRIRAHDSFTVSLFDLCIDSFIAGTTDAFFGPKLRQMQPNHVDAFESWEHCNWKFLFQLPSFFAKDMLKAKKTLLGGFANYYKLPRSKRPDSIFFVNELEDMLREAGLTEEEMACFTMMHYWAIIGNTYKLAFWLVAHLMHDSYLLQQIRDEVSPAVKGENVDETYLLEQCPKLESLLNEVLRLMVTSSLARVVMEPTMVGGKLLQPGSRVMLPINALHYDVEIWGQKPQTLTPNRFIDNVKLTKNSSYRPWGGGQTLCPGRFFARRSVNVFVAMLLSRYDLKAGPGGFPKADGAKPAPGMVVVGKGQDVMLICTPRRQVNERKRQDIVETLATSKS